MITPPRLRLNVIILPQEEIVYFNRESEKFIHGLGFFFYPPPLQIVLAGHPSPDEDITEWLDGLRDTMCHEWAHYEQYLRQKPVQERGVKVRTRNLIRKAEAILSHESALSL